MIPIVGARTEVQVKDNLGCLDFELTRDQLKRLDEKSKIQLGFPHDIISEGARTYIRKHFCGSANHPGPGVSMAP